MMVLTFDGKPRVISDVVPSVLTGWLDAIIFGWNGRELPDTDNARFFRINGGTLVSIEFWV